MSAIQEDVLLNEEKMREEEALDRIERGEDITDPKITAEANNDQDGDDQDDDEDYEDGDDEEEDG